MKTGNAIAERLKEIVSQELGIDEREITPNSSFVEDLGADSLDQVELVMLAEEEFGIAIDEEEAERLTTFQLLVDYVVAATSRHVRTGT